MKRILMILMIAALTVVTASCGVQQKKASTEPPTEAETQLHTVPAEEQTQPVEWAPVDCEISLESSDSIYAESADFLTFALVGSSDDDCELRFTLEEETAAMLTQQEADIAYYVTVNGEKLKSTVSFNDDCTVLILSGGYSYGEMCSLATEIRGL